MQFSGDENFAIEDEEESSLPARRILYGETIEHDLRLKKITARERFLLSVIIPRIRSTRDALREWGGRSSKETVWIPCLIVLLLHVGTVILCAHPSFGALWPLPDDDQERDSLEYGDFGPPMINVLAALVLSYYAN